MLAGALYGYFTYSSFIIGMMCLMGSLDPEFIKREDIPAVPKPSKRMWMKLLIFVLVGAVLGGYYRWTISFSIQ